MIFSGVIKVPASRQEVFAKLNNVEFFASCIEGISQVEQISPTQYSAQLKTKVAYIQFTFSITVEITESIFPERIVAKSQGVPIGMIGRLVSLTTAQLLEDAEGTIISYEIDMSLTGKLGSIGQPVLKSKTKELEKQFAENLRNSFSGSLTSPNNESV